MIVNIFSDARTLIYGPVVSSSLSISRRLKSRKGLLTAKESNAYATQPISKLAAKGSKSSAKTEGKKNLVEDSELGLQYLVKSEQLNQLLSAVRARKLFEGTSKIVIEGRRLIFEALKHNLCMNAILFSKKEALFSIRHEVLKAQKAFGTEIFKVAQHELETWSTLRTSPGLLGIFERPTQVQHRKKEGEISSPFRMPITVVCDNIREPANLGSIIRTCAGVACEQVIVIKGCCDPWESKALRGGCGGQFHIPIRDDVSWDELQSHIWLDKGSECRVFIAESNLKRVLCSSHKSVYCYNNLGTLGAHNVVIIGGESHGVSDNAYKYLRRNKFGRCIYIPLADCVDSLNVASALTLILYEFRSQITNSTTKDTVKA